uniref:Uncharacterized protein n=1 Tax=Timema tahoe TaxID=61484 RepID=A0A7R9IDP7_9NEOP|nr:unnamed protein product [Timema tahoe]
MEWASFAYETSPSFNFSLAHSQCLDSLNYERTNTVRWATYMDSETQCRAQSNVPMRSLARGSHASTFPSLVPHTRRFSDDVKIAGRIVILHVSTKLGDPQSMVVTLRRVELHIPVSVKKNKLGEQILQQLGAFVSTKSPRRFPEGVPSCTIPGLRAHRQRNLFAGHGPKSMSAIPGTRAPEKSGTSPPMPVCLGSLEKIPHSTGTEWSEELAPPIDYPVTRSQFRYTLPRAATWRRPERIFGDIPVPGGGKGSLVLVYMKRARAQIASRPHTSGRCLTTEHRDPSSDRMSHLYLWQGLHKIIVTFETSEPCAEVRKICHVNTHMFALTKSHSLYCGKIENGEDSYSVHLKKTNISAIDISCNKNSLYFVNDVGQVFRTTESLDTYEEIVLKEDAKCCVHGYKTPGHKVKVKNVSVSDTSCLFVTESGQLWASGNHPQLSIQCSEPKKVTFFEKRCVLSVTSGADFHLALVFKPLLCAQDKDRSDSDDEDDDGEVFVSSCVQCVNESISSPISTQSMSDICPLGLPIVHTNEEQYSSSTASKDNSADDKKSTDDSTSLSTEDKTTQQKCSSNCNETVNANVEPSDKQALSEDICATLVNGRDEVEHEVPSKTEGEPTTDQESETDSLKEERKNEFFINTDAARQFLTRQLSWVSGYGGAGEDLLVECAEASLVRPTRMLKQNVSNMASLVYEGVKTVGDRVATLSRHMSGGSETSDGVSGGLLECESFEDLSEECKPAAPSVASSLRFEEFPWSSSTGTSERGEGSDLGIADRIHEMARRGNALLNPELWSWGGAAYGQLGLSDTGKRSRPVLISRLTGLGVRKIVSGRYHSLAVTLDGRAFAWGRNSARQVTLESAQDQSTPQPLTFVTERVKDVGAGDSHSIILSHPGALYFIGKNGVVTSRRRWRRVVHHGLEGRRFELGHLN